jgi:hypothetical protein
MLSLPTILPKGKNWAYEITFLSVFFILCQLLSQRIFMKFIREIMPLKMT